MGMGKGRQEGSHRGGIPVNDPEIQSAVNTIRNWRFRRGALGKQVSDTDVATRIRVLWPDLDDETRKKIASEVMK